MKNVYKGPFLDYTYLFIYFLLTKQEILLGKGTRVESCRVREPRRTALPHGSQSPVLW